jgi:adenylate cyclase
MIAFIRRFFARRRIKNLFGSHLSPAMVERMGQSGEMPSLGGAEVELTAFFANVPGYVGIAEQVPLKRLPALMNAYFEAGTAAIQEEGGTLDKFIGDAIVAMLALPSGYRTTRYAHASPRSMAALDFGQGGHEAS